MLGHQASPASPCLRGSGQHLGQEPAVLSSHINQGHSKSASRGPRENGVNSCESPSKDSFSLDDREVLALITAWMKHNWARVWEYLHDVITEPLNSLFQTPWRPGERCTNTWGGYEPAQAAVQASQVGAYAADVHCLQSWRLDPRPRCGQGWSS